MWNPGKENAASSNNVKKGRSQRESLHISMYCKYYRTSLDNFVSFERVFKFLYFNTSDFTLL